MDLPPDQANVRLSRSDFSSRRMLKWFISIYVKRYALSSLELCLSIFHVTTNLKYHFLPNIVETLYFYDMRSIMLILKNSLQFLVKERCNEIPEAYDARKYAYLFLYVRTLNCIVSDIADVSVIFEGVHDDVVTRWFRKNVTFSVDESLDFLDVLKNRCYTYCNENFWCSVDWYGLADVNEIRRTYKNDIAICRNPSLMSGDSKFFFKFPMSTTDLNFLVESEGIFLCRGCEVTELQKCKNFAVLDCCHVLCLPCAEMHLTSKLNG